MYLCITFIDHQLYALFAHGVSLNLLLWEYSNIAECRLASNPVLLNGVMDPKCPKGI